MTSRGPTERDVLGQLEAPDRLNTGFMIPHSYARDKLRKKCWIEKGSRAGVQVCWRITRYGRMELDIHRKEAV